MPQAATSPIDEYLESLHATIDKQKGQLALALAVLVSLGFDLMDFVS